jgi:hypothetical protein
LKGNIFLILRFFLHVWLKELNKIEMMLVLKKLRVLIKHALRTKIAK